MFIYSHIISLCQSNYWSFKFKIYLSEEQIGSSCYLMARLTELPQPTPWALASGREMDFGGMTKILERHLDWTSQGSKDRVLTSGAEERTRAIMRRWARDAPSRHREDHARWNHKPRGNRKRPPSRLRGRQGFLRTQKAQTVKKK